MAITAEFFGGPWDGEWRVLHEGERGGFVLLGQCASPDSPDAEVRGEYRPMRYAGDGHYFRWHPSGVGR